MPETAAADKKNAAPPPPPPAKGNLTVIDLGEHSRKRIKKLRRGEGRLMEKIEDTLGDLEEQGVIEASAQTVVIIVREEPSLGSIFGGDD